MFLNNIGMSYLFRSINHYKILILVYHGLTLKKREFQPWIHLPINVFENQIKYIKKHYNVLKLSEIIKAIKLKKQLPKNSASITFDDGYYNNFSLAFPVLKKYNVPATIYLTTGYIGSKKLLPMDQAFLIIKEAHQNSSYSMPENGFGPIFFKSITDRQISYQKTTELLKKYEVKKQLEFLNNMKDKLKCEYDPTAKKIIDDFSILGWDEIEQMHNSNLIEFGAHSDSHNILTRITYVDASKEISKSRKIIEEKLNCNINLFAFPNGTEEDFSIEHIKYLKDNNFEGAVTTIPKLNCITDSVYNLGRMSVGSDFSSDPDYFALRTSGLIQVIKKVVNYVQN
jgi:peptidoglycan/xylan/chitin deacetylase (PgdA/CDA1 family)